MEAVVDLHLSAAVSEYKHNVFLISYHSNQSGMSGHGICPVAPDVRMLEARGGPGFKTS